MLEFIALLFKISTGLALFVIGVLVVAHLINIAIDFVADVLIFFVDIASKVCNIFWG